ncbi:hypothetical protein EVAR_12972_1 [Eumeta japonica]|uniref:adenylate cyclase n=1 Tax=Eumeta variegata TaxID=151549 RepID=A0A4C1TWT0_EUMVA|nr:hypothetical protein EVAR_12972_1 [Eumeta japonica]
MHQYYLNGAVRTGSVRRAADVEAAADLDDSAAIPEEEDIINSAIEVASNESMRANHMGTWTLRFRAAALEAGFANLAEETFKSNVMCCAVLWLCIVAVQLVVHYNCSWLWLVLTVMSAPLLLSFAVVMMEEFGAAPRKLRTLSAWLCRERTRRTVFICSFITTMSISSTIKLYICPPSFRLADYVFMENCTQIGNNSSDVCITNATDECYRPEYVVFTWILCLVALTSILKLYYLIKTLLAVINVTVYMILLRIYYNVYTFSSAGESGLPFYVQMMTLMMVFLCMVVYHARLLEVTARLDLLWKLDAEAELRKAEEMRRINNQLLKHILPDHVANYFLSKERHPDDLYSQWRDEVGVMFASIPNFSEFYSEDVNKGIECIRLLNEIIVDFDKLLSEPRFRCIEKIKTIGSTYMAASGLNPDIKGQGEGEGEGECEHACALVEFAFAMRPALDDINKHSNNNFRLRVGISCGPLVGGVIGARKPVYDIWGDTVNEASRMESTGALDRIQVTKYTKQVSANTKLFLGYAVLGHVKTFMKLLERRGYDLEARGIVEVKGKGRMETWWVRGKGETRRAPAARQPAAHRSLAALVITMLQARRMHAQPLEGTGGKPKETSRSTSLRADTQRRKTISLRLNERMRGPPRPFQYSISHVYGTETGFRPHTSSLVDRRHHPAHAAPASSLSAPHTPTVSHEPSPHISTVDCSRTDAKTSKSRLKAASFSSRTRPQQRDRSPKVRDTSPRGDERRAALLPLPVRDHGLLLPRPQQRSQTEAPEPEDEPPMSTDL